MHFIGTKIATMQFANKVCMLLASNESKLQCIRYSNATTERYIATATATAVTTSKMANYTENYHANYQ